MLNEKSGLTSLCMCVSVSHSPNAHWRIEADDFWMKRRANAYEMECFCGGTGNVCVWSILMRNVRVRETLTPTDLCFFFLVLWIFIHCTCGSYFFFVSLLSRLNAFCLCAVSFPLHVALFLLFHHRHFSFWFLYFFHVVFLSRFATSILRYTLSANVICFEFDFCCFYFASWLTT